MFNNELLEIIPEFNLIKDSDLKKKTIKVWEVALKAGGWKISYL